VADAYNGWANYETWLVHLWLTNEQATLEAALEFVREYPHFGGEADGNAAQALKEFVEDVLLEDRPYNGLMADLVNAALGSVLWIQCVRALLDR